MKYKLIDYTTHDAGIVLTGTCEMCMSSRHLEEQMFYLQDENDVIHRIEGHEWDWGDLDQIYIDNLAHFAAWLQDTDIEPPYDQELGYNYFWLKHSVVSQYEYECSEQGQWEKNIRENVTVKDSVIEIICNDTMKQYIDDVEIRTLVTYATNDGSVSLGEDTWFKTDYEWEMDDVPLFGSSQDIVTKKIHSCGIDCILYEDDNVITIVFDGYDENDKYINSKYISVGTVPCTVKIKIHKDSAFPEIDVDDAVDC